MILIFRGITLRRIEITTLENVNTVVIETAITRLKALGAEIVDPITVSSIKLFDKSELELFLYELKAGLNRYLAEHPRAKVRSLDELIRFNQVHADRVMPYFQQELLEGHVDSGIRLPCLKWSIIEGLSFSYFKTIKCLYATLK